WRELEATSGSQLLTMTGALMIGEATSDVVVGAQASAREHGLDAELLDTNALRRRYHGHVVHDGDVAVLDRQAGVLNPEAAVGAMLAQVPQVVREKQMKSIAELRSSFDAVVVAAGPWTPELIDWIPRCRLVRPR
ncbi:MAG: FAD-dependent oxidoreductase, partial [Chloroflexi bacterium]